MGRCIESKINGEWEFVWKYVFGAQSSEMYRIYEDLGIGEYHPVSIEYKDDETGKHRVCEYLETRSGADADILILKQDDVIELSEWIEILREDSSLRKKDECFIAMLEAIRNFMLVHSEHDEIIFEGEF
jgi:hypothetical protein